MQKFVKDVVIVGGGGHVGLPLGLALADAGCSVVCYDRDAAAVDQVRAAKMPFFEAGAGELLERVLASGRFEASDDPRVVADAEHVVVVVGTPVDEHLNPDPKFVLRAIEEMVDELRDGQLLVLRSTVYPGVTAMVERSLAKSGRNIDVSFCPERIAEGRALVELRELPQIVSGRTERAVQRAEALFRRLTESIVYLDVGGSRAREAVHEHVALHQVRGREPAVHDRQRLRARLRAHPRAPSCTTTRARPTCPAPDSRRVRAS